LEGDQSEEMPSFPLPGRQIGCRQMAANGVHATWFQRAVKIALLASRATAMKTPGAGEAMAIPPPGTNVVTDGTKSSGDQSRPAPSTSTAIACRKEAPLRSGSGCRRWRRKGRHCQCGRVPTGVCGQRRRRVEVDGCIDSGDNRLGRPLGDERVLRLRRDLVHARASPKLWMHGHTHDRCDYMLGETRVVVNPLGAQEPGGVRAGVLRSGMRRLSAQWSATAIRFDAFQLAVGPRRSIVFRS
jgi:hypothetical protein